LFIFAQKAEGTRKDEKGAKQTPQDLLRKKKGQLAAKVSADQTRRNEKKEHSPQKLGAESVHAKRREGGGKEEKEVEPLRRKLRYVLYRGEEDHQQPRAPHTEP